MPAVSRFAFFAASGAVACLPAAAQTREPIDEIVVVADPLELVELESSRSVYGLDLSYAEVPRAISAISDETIERFNIETVDDLAAVAPGTFTGSFFGVPGSVTLRGNRADSYFRGFKRAENPGTFPTPIGASERIEVVRGPTPAIYGAGRVGGFVNVTPLTALTQKQIGERGRLVEIGGTAGSYEKRILHGSAGAAFDLGGDDAGVYAYAEYENSNSFYRGIEPKRLLIQSAFTLADADRFSFEIGGAYHSSEGYKQTIGWNRVTQDLIDNGTYITGTDTDLRDLNGDGKLTPDEVDAAVGSFFGSSNIRQFVDFGVFLNPAFSLDQGVGTARLDPRTVFISDRDIADSETATVYADLAINVSPDQTLRFQAFYDSLDGDLHQSYGFAAQYIADVVELRASYEFPFALGGVEFHNILGTSWRHYDNETRQTFLSGYLVVDRRDLTAGETSGDIFDDPFSSEPNGIGWDTNLSSVTTDLAFFAVSDVALTDRLSFLASLRLDRFTAKSINTGSTIFNPALGFATFEGDDFKASYEASLRYDFGAGVTAYATYAENNALETNDGGGIEVDRIDQENFVADSNLIEAGVKAGRDDLFASLAVYRQKRQRSDPFGNLDEETSRGVEAELKYLISDNWSLNSAITLQEAKIGAPGPCGSGNGEFIVLPPSWLGILEANGYGGLFAALNASCVPELQNGYKRRTTPDVMASGFLTYTSPRTSYGAFGATAGVIYVGETGGKIAGAIRLPRYALGKTSFYWAYDNLSLTAHIDNLFDKRHFIPVQNVYEEVGVLPGRGREFSITLKAAF
ncbi:MAG: TonB-dependent siderophore receptor [Pseudomonadota bacterium]